MADGSSDSSINNSNRNNSKSNRNNSISYRFISNINNNNSNSNISSSNSRDISRDIIPTIITNYMNDVLAIGCYEGQTYVVFCYPLAKVRKTYMIKRLGADMTLRDFRNENLNWNDELVGMEVHGRHMCLWQRINCYAEAGSGMDEIVTVIDLESQQMIKYMTFNNCAAQDGMTVAIGCRSLFHLNTKTQKVKKCSLYGNNEIEISLRGLFPTRSNIDLVSSTSDSYLMIEQDRSVSAIDIQTHQVIWKLPISSRGAFKCFNGVGLHLEGSERRVGIINIHTGKASYYDIQSHKTAGMITYHLLASTVKHLQFCDPRMV